jgi:hypothetical protein
VAGCGLLGGGAATASVETVTSRPTAAAATAGVTASPTGGDGPGTPTAAAGRGLRADGWTELADAPVALTEVAAAALDGRIWVVGGLDEQGRAVSTVQVYDPSTDAWTGGPELPDPVHHAALVAAEGSLFLLGGYVGSGFGQTTSAVRHLAPGSTNWQTAEPLPDGRAAGAAAWDGSRFVYGGGVGPRGLAGDVFVLETDTWQRIGGLAEPREHLAATSDGRGAAWFLGGRRAGLDTNLGTAERLAGAELVRVGDLPTPRGGVAAFWSEHDGACLVGGEGPPGTFAEVECIADDGTVTRLPSLRFSRHGLGAAALGDAAYVLLGGPQPGLTVSGRVEGLLLAP